MFAALLAILSAGWTPPQARGPWAVGLRERVAVLYADLETPAMRLRLDVSRTKDSLRGPYGAAGWRLARDGGARPGGTEILRLEWTDSVGTVLRTDRIPARLERDEMVPVAARRLFAGGSLDTADLRWEWRRTDGTVQAPAPRNGLHGRRLSRGVGPGQALLASAIEPPVSFRRQDKVRIFLVREGTRIVSEGIALEDGRAGRFVRVTGPFGTELRGRVADDSTVVVD